MAFPVIKDESKELKNVARPIGIIIVNKKNKEKTFDMAEYEFCENLDSFKKSYYVVDNHSPFWPNKTKENEEHYKVLLDLAQNLYYSSSLLKKPKKVFYENYITKLKSFLPEDYWIFYEQLKSNKFSPVTEELKEKRKKAETEFLLEKKKLEEKTKEQKVKLKQKFKETLMNNVLDFIKKEVVTNLKGNGSYTKLLFYTELGKYARKIDYSKFENCYNPLLSKSVLNKNINQATEDIKFDILKIISKACKNIVYNNIAIDTISKVLIVFLNAMLIEEMKNEAIQTFEDEITECITIYKEDSHRIKNIDAKKFLDKTFENLCKDYYIVDKNELSDIFYGYLFVHNSKK
ncbi:MAG: hypothetical protein IKI95_04745 [Clostridia bacterium]|nr:hypothetical protein [Clostridia bacterium]